MKQMDFVDDKTQGSNQATRSNGPRNGHKRLTADIPAELHKRLKLQALKEECTVTDIIVEASKAWLATRKNK